jgi:hypothetical protein
VLYVPGAGSVAVAAEEASPLGMPIVTTAIPHSVNKVARMGACFRLLFSAAHLGSGRSRLWELFALSSAT